MDHEGRSKDVVLKTQTNKISKNQTKMKILTDSNSVDDCV